MEIPRGTQGYSPKGLLLSASILAFWLPQDSQAALRIQKIPEQPQKNQDLLLSVHGIPSAFQDFIWYLGEETSGGTRLFTYIPDLQRPQRDGSAMGQRDITGFPNGSMLLRNAQPADSGTYQVAVAINSDWTMKAKTKVQVAEMHKEPPAAHLPTHARIMAAAIVVPVAAGALLIGGVTYVLVRRGRSPRSLTTEKPELGPRCEAGDSRIYEVMPSPAVPVSPLSDRGPTNPATPPPPPSLPLPELEPESHHYQDLLNPDPAPYCQLVPTS